MIDFVLDDLCRPAGEGFEASLKPLVLILHLDGLPALGFPGASEGETALLRLIWPGLFDNLRVEHDCVLALVVKDYDPLADADHIGCHAHTAVLVGSQGVQQILDNGQILQGGRFGLLGEERFVSHDLSYHILLLHYALRTSPKGKFMVYLYKIAQTGEKGKSRAVDDMEKKVTEVVAALIWDGDRFLICQRPAHKARGLLWEFVGGKVEPGESKEQALVRECREELAVTISVSKVFMEVDHDYPDLNVHLTLFNAAIIEGTPQMLEHNDIRWITPKEIPQYEFCPADKEILRRLRFISSSIIPYSS